MCLWNDKTREKFVQLATQLSADGTVFGALEFRNQLRTLVGPAEPINYGDVFSELWHYWRKGKFAQPYIIRTKTVPTPGDLPDEVTVEYWPENGVVLKKVAASWHGKP